MTDRKWMYNRLKNSKNCFNRNDKFKAMAFGDMTMQAMTLECHIEFRKPTTEELNLINEIKAIKWNPMWSGKG